MDICICSRQERKEEEGIRKCAFRAIYGKCHQDEDAVYQKHTVLNTRLSVWVQTKNSSPASLNGENECL